MEITLAQSNSSSGGTSSIVAIADENGKITAFRAESTGDAWCGFSSENSVYTMYYRFDETVEIQVYGEYYISDSQIPDNLLSALWG